MAIETIQLGKILITHKGAWSSAVAYEALDVVSYIGSSYLALTAPPIGTLVTNATYWRTLSKSAYQYAVEAGYTGTEEEFGILIDSIQDRELVSNKVTSISITSTDTQYPSAKATHTALGLKPDKTVLETTEEVAAQSLVELKERIDALEELIKQGILNNIIIKTLSVETFQMDGASLILTGADAPTVIPDFIGQFYIKTTATTACYQSTGTTAVGDWKQIG
jgi:hypothetical protein